MELTTGGRFVAALVIVGAIVGGVYALKSKGGFTKIAQGTSPHITVGLNTWNGFDGIFLANHGKAQNVESDFFKKYGVLVDVKVFDDPNAGKAAFISGEIDTWQATVDSFPVDAASMRKHEIKYIMQTDWSNGGDVIVAVEGIRNVAQLKGHTIAVAEGSPSHSLLLSVVKSGELALSDLQIKKVSDGSEAAKLFKARAVDAAVVWSPDDQDCVAAVKGSSIVVSTKTASRIIADAIYAKSSYIQSHPKEIHALVEGWLNANAEINSSDVKKGEAADFAAVGFSEKKEDALIGMSNARLTTLGDNLNFFGLTNGYNGVTASSLYDKMCDAYHEIGLAGAGLPNWRELADVSALQGVQLAGAIHSAEAEPKFEHISVAKAQALPAFANKKVSVNFASNSATLDAEAKNVIAASFGSSVQSFKNARILIEGNTDNTGPDTINVPLSQGRALSARNYIVRTYGVDPNRITTVGNGSRNATGMNPEDRANDRRTDFKLLGE